MKAILQHHEWLVVQVQKKSPSRCSCRLLYGSVSEPHDEVAWVDYTEVAQQFDVC